MRCSKVMRARTRTKLFFLPGLTEKFFSVFLNFSLVDADPIALLWAKDELKWMRQSFVRHKNVKHGRNPTQQGKEIKRH